MLRINIIQFLGKRNVVFPEINGPFKFIDKAETSRKATELMVVSKPITFIVSGLGIISKNLSGRYSLARITFF